MPSAKEFRSHTYAAEVAWVHQHMTGDMCYVMPSRRMGRWYVYRNTGDEWVVV